MDDKVKIIPGFVPISGHIHSQWFEIDHNEHGTIISCPEGHRRILMKNGNIAHWDESSKTWVKGI